MRREPSDVAVLSARLVRAFPSISPYSAASVAEELCTIERAQRRHAERCCNGYRKLAPLRHGITQDPACPRGMDWRWDSEAEGKAGKRIVQRLKAWAKRIAELHGKAWTWHDHTHSGFRCTLQDGTAHEAVLAEWTFELQHDPRGRVLLVRLPGELEASTV